MKIFIFGNADSIFVKNFIRDICNSGDELTLFSNKNSKYKNYYLDYNCKVVSMNQDSLLEKIPKIRVISFRNKCVHYIKKEKPDVVHFLQMNSFARHIFENVSNKCRKIITFFGSDLLRANEKKLLTYTAALEYSDYITLASDAMIMALKKRFGHQYDAKIRKRILCIDGLATIDHIMRLEKENAFINAKRRMGIPADCLTIAVGYNANLMQQHIKVIHNLTKSSLAKQKNTVLLLQMTYGEQSDGYIREVEKELMENGFKYIIFEDFMDTETSSLFRLATDIFIHAQVSDAISASIAEHLAANSYLINPDWISYDEYDNIGVDFKKYSKIEEISQCVDGYYSDFRRESNNANLIQTFFSEYSGQQRWMDLYK